MTLFCSSEEFLSLCRDLPRDTDRIRLQAKGGSMEPCIKSGDWLDIVLCHDEKHALRKGDIALFKKDSALYIHRILQIDNDTVTVKGDQAFECDGTISRSDIFGVVTTVERSGRKIDLTSRYNRFVFAVLADCAFVMRYVHLLVRKVTGAGAALVNCVQGLSIYRRLVKKLFHKEIIIREAQAEDAEQIRDLYVMAGHDVSGDIISIKKEGFWLVAELREQIVGALTITRHNNNSGLWVIFGLEVKPLFRGLGIGRKIVIEALARAKRSGARSVGLFMNKKSTPAKNLYAGLGFIITDDFPKDFCSSPDELYLVYHFRA